MPLEAFQAACPDAAFSVISDRREFPSWERLQGLFCSALHFIRSQTSLAFAGRQFYDLVGVCVGRQELFCAATVYILGSCTIFSYWYLPFLNLFFTLGNALKFVFLFYFSLFLLLNSGA